MKTTKIPKSITVTVREGVPPRTAGKLWKMILADDAGGAIHLGMGQRMEDIRKQWPRTPELPYRVTYSVSQKGSMVKLFQLHPVVKNLCVCFLPHSWEGLRVSRRVEKVKK